MQEQQHRPVGVDGGTQGVLQVTDATPGVAWCGRVGGDDPDALEVDGLDRVGEEAAPTELLRRVEGAGLGERVVIARNRHDRDGRRLEQRVELLPVVGLTELGDVALDHEQLRPPRGRLGDGGAGATEGIGGVVSAGLPHLLHEAETLLAQVQVADRGDAGAAPPRKLGGRRDLVASDHPAVHRHVDGVAALRVEVDDVGRPGPAGIADDGVVAVDHHREVAGGEVTPGELGDTILDGERLDGREAGEGEGGCHGQPSAGSAGFLRGRAGASVPIGFRPESRCLAVTERGVDPLAFQVLTHLLGALGDRVGLEE